MITGMILCDSALLPVSTVQPVTFLLDKDFAHPN